MKPMATRRRARVSRLHRSIIDAEHREGWPVLSGTQARAAAKRVPAASAINTPAARKDYDTLIETYLRILR